MTKYGFFSIGGEKTSIFDINALTTTHYSISMSKFYSPLTQNPAPNSCRASLGILESPNSVYHKTGFDKIKGISQSLITIDSRALFTGKSKEDRAIAGESKVLPRLMQRGFEGVWCSLSIDSKTESKMPRKFSYDSGSKGFESYQGMIAEKVLKCSTDERLRHKGGEGNFTICLYIAKA